MVEILISPLHMPSECQRFMYEYVEDCLQILISRNKVPASLSMFSRNILLLRKIALWTIWIDKNHLSFKQNKTKVGG